MAKLLITGGQGFIGRAIVQKALEDGHEVTVLDIERPEGDVDYRFVYGNILKPNEVIYACKGQDVVIHSAANPNLWARMNKDIEHVNVQGTLNVAEACLKNQVPKLIHISSDCTLIGPNHRIIKEDNHPSLKDMKGVYCQSKWKADDCIRQAREQGLKATIIHPGVPLGPTQQQAPFVAMLKAFMDGKIKGYMDGQIGFIDVNDVAKITLKAMDGPDNRHYVAVSECISIKALFEQLSQMCNQPMPKIKAPYWLAMGGAFFDEQLAYLKESGPIATLAGVYLAHMTQGLDNQLTTEELGVEYAPCKNALEQMIQSNQRSDSA